MSTEAEPPKPILATIRINIGSFELYWPQAPKEATDDLRKAVMEIILKHHTLENGKVC